MKRPRLDSRPVPRNPLQRPPLAASSHTQLPGPAHQAAPSAEPAGQLASAAPEAKAGLPGRAPRNAGVPAPAVHLCGLRCGSGCLVGLSVCLWSGLWVWPPCLITLCLSRSAFLSVCLSVGGLVPDPALPLMHSIAWQPLPPWFTSVSPSICTRGPGRPARPSALPGHLTLADGSAGTTTPHPTSHTPSLHPRPAQGLSLPPPPTAQTGLSTQTRLSVILTHSRGREARPHSSEPLAGFIQTLHTCSHGALRCTFLRSPEVGSRGDACRGAWPGTGSPVRQLWEAADGELQGPR